MLPWTPVSGCISLHSPSYPSDIGVSGRHQRMHYPNRTINLSQLTVNHCRHGTAWWSPLIRVIASEIAFAQNLSKYSLKLPCRAKNYLHVYYVAHIICWFVMYAIHCMASIAVLTSILNPTPRIILIGYKEVSLSWIDVGCMWGLQLCLKIEWSQHAIHIVFILSCCIDHRYGWMGGLQLRSRQSILLAVWGSCIFQVEPMLA